MITVQEAIVKAKAYGEGDLKIMRLPPSAPRVETSGFCDLHGKKETVIFPILNGMYNICWGGIQKAKAVYGETKWEYHLKLQLQKIKADRLQKEAQKRAGRF